MRSREGKGLLTPAKLCHVASCFCHCNTPQTAAASHVGSQVWLAAFIYLPVRTAVCPPPFPFFSLLLLSPQLAGLECATLQVPGRGKSTNPLLRLFSRSKSNKPRLTPRSDGVKTQDDRRKDSVSVDTTPPVPHEICRGRFCFRTVPSQRTNWLARCGCQCAVCSCGSCSTRRYHSSTQV